MPVHPKAHPYGAAGRPEQTGGRRIGVLLSHGFTGSPFTMRGWGEDLAARGYAVQAPRLPGHGTSWQELNDTRWEDWYGELTTAFDRLRQENDEVFVGGLSMGGGLALQLAADRSAEVAGLMLVNPAVATERKDVLALPVMKHVVRSFPGITNDTKKAGVEEYGYSRTPLKAAHSMMQGWKGLRGSLRQVTAPIVMFRSLEDHVVDPSSGRIILSTVSSRDVSEVLLENSYHVATLDNDAELIRERSAEFLARVGGGVAG